MFPVLTVKLRLWELTPETDARGFVLCRDFTRTTLRFHDLDETLKLEGFNHQNAIFKLDITRQERADGPSCFDIRFVPAFGMGASFRCYRVEVVEAAPYKSDRVVAESDASPNPGPSEPVGNFVEGGGSASVPTNSGLRITRNQIIPMLLKACPSFQTMWGDEQRAAGSEDHVLYVAFGALGAHLRYLRSRQRTSELSAVDSTVSRLRNQGDAEVRKLAQDLRNCIDSALSA